MTIDNLKSPDLAAPGLSRAKGTAADGASRPAPGTTDLLSLDDLHISVHHGAATAIRGVSLGIRPGEIVGLVGESGSGKTLTCRAALGVLPAGVTIDHGSMTFAGHDLTALSRRGWEDVHGNHLGAVFQDPASYLNPSITVGNQLAEVLRVKLGLSRRAAAPALGRAVHRGRPAPAGARVPPDPGRAVRRHAAAGHDRHRDLL